MFVWRGLQSIVHPAEYYLRFPINQQHRKNFVVNQVLLVHQIEQVAEALVLLSNIHADQSVDWYFRNILHLVHERHHDILDFLIVYRY